MLDIEDRIFMFLIRMRRRYPFATLSLLFGVANSTVELYYNELLLLFYEVLVPRLVYPLSKAETVRITPEDFARDLPDIQVIWDATGFKMKSKENVLLSRLLYSAYHHTSEGFAVFGK